MVKKIKGLKDHSYLGTKLSQFVTFLGKKHSLYPNLAGIYGLKAVNGTA